MINAEKITWFLDIELLRTIYGCEINTVSINDYLFLENNLILDVSNNTKCSSKSLVTRRIRPLLFELTSQLL